MYMLIESIAIMWLIQKRQMVKNDEITSSCRYHFLYLLDCQGCCQNWACIVLFLELYFWFSCQQKLFAAHFNWKLLAVHVDWKLLFNKRYLWVYLQLISIGCYCLFMPIKNISSPCHLKEAMHLFAVHINNAVNKRYLCMYLQLISIIFHWPFVSTEFY